MFFFRSNLNLSRQKGALCSSQKVTRQHLAYLLLPPAFQNQFDKIFSSIILGNPLLFLLLQNETLPSCQKMKYQHWTRLKPKNAHFQKPEYCVKITFTKYQTDTSNLRKMRDFNRQKVSRQ